MKNKKINKVPTVTVAVSAYNEEKNISAFIKSVLMQKKEGYILQNIWIYSDGSNDNTVKIAKSFKDKKIKVFHFKERKGKSSKLNIIYKNLTSDYLIQSDADVILSHEYVVRDMIKPLIMGKNVGMCGGNPLPMKAKTFTESAVNCTVEAYIPLRKTLRGGNNIFSADGRMLAFKKNFVKNINIPEVDVVANDAYMYYACKTSGFEYTFVESGVVLFRSPQSLGDQIKQNTRFLAMPIKMNKYFDNYLVRDERRIPKIVMLIQMIKVFVRHPLQSIYIYGINLYCRFRVRRTENKITALWSIANTTKKVKANL